MTNLELIGILIIITILFFLFVWLFKVFASMSEEEKEIYEGSKCPFDGKHCGIIGRSLQKSYVTKICQNCPRYDQWLKKGLNENELRDKIKDITDG